MGNFFGGDCVVVVILVIAPVVVVIAIVLVSVHAAEVNIGCELKYPETCAYRLAYAETDWISVHRRLNAPDTIHLTKCLSPLLTCSVIPDSSSIPNSNSASFSRQQCSCQCKADSATFLPSIRSCIDKLG
ncbi:unnamed protein product [Thelazia callipaeda]|uniref:Shavenoid isoform B-like N-terminal domain-containing protein n=1 Tax=Thelazia callipaeda TaxID=103827 RepID=A0A0N5D6H6_THECL|nr:unnamed protein product [Thelazia callipaeda]